MIPELKNEYAQLIGFFILFIGFVLSFKFLPNETANKRLFSSIFLSVIWSIPTSILYLGGIHIISIVIFSLFWMATLCEYILPDIFIVMSQLIERFKKTKVGEEISYIKQALMGFFVLIVLLITLNHKAHESNYNFNNHVTHNNANKQFTRNNIPKISPCRAIAEEFAKKNKFKKTAN